MSFTTNIKDEITSSSFGVSEGIAELSGLIRSCGNYNKKKIELATENMMIAKRIYIIIKDNYQVLCKMTTKQNNIFNKNNVYFIEIEQKVPTILKDLSIIDEKGSRLDSPKKYMVDSEEDTKAYLRGVFLARGSINDPSTSMYHLEFLFDNKHEAVFVQRLLNKFELDSKIILKDTKYMVYLKDSEKISDFLKVIGATNAVLYYENVRALKEQKNITNRLNNCEQANVDKIILTSNQQIKEIDKIDEIIGLDALEDKIKEAAEYRQKYPEASLQELSEIISLETNKKITKSGLNHRFRKIKEIYTNIINNS